MQETQEYDRSFIKQDLTYNFLSTMTDIDVVQIDN